MTNIKVTDEQRREQLEIINDCIQAICEVDRMISCHWWHKEVHKVGCKTVNKLFKLIGAAASFGFTQEQLLKVAQGWGYETVDEYIKGIVQAKL